MGKAKQPQKKTENKKIELDKQTKFNRWIIIIKIAAAILLFFCCSFFFFQNMGMFWRDFTSPLFFFPVLFFSGIILICIYISKLVGHVEDNNMFSSDRYDLGYRLIFTVTFMVLLIRSFLGDFDNPDPLKGTNLNVPIFIIILAIISGIVTWVLPKIKDNDNSDF